MGVKPIRYFINVRRTVTEIRLEFIQIVIDTGAHYKDAGVGAAHIEGRILIIRIVAKKYIISFDLISNVCDEARYDWVVVRMPYLCLKTSRTRNGRMQAGHESVWPWQCCEQK